MAINRRGFIGGLGGLVATASLPSFADDPSAFPKRGKFERLSLACAHIAMEDRFSPTATEYVVGGNFMFHGREVLFS